MTIIPALLEKGDMFRFGSTGCLYCVTKIEGDVMHFKAQSYQKQPGGTISTISIKSKQRLTLVLDGWFNCPPEDLKKFMPLLPENSHIFI